MEHNDEMKFISPFNEFRKIHGTIMRNVSNGLDINDSMSKINSSIIKLAEMLMEYGDKYVEVIDLLTDYASFLVNDGTELRYEECETNFEQICKFFEYKVYLVNVDCPDYVLKDFINSVHYSNMEIVSWDKFVDDIYAGNCEQYCNGYVSFVENNYKYDVWKLLDTSLQLSAQQEDMVICFRALEGKTAYLQELEPYFRSTLPAHNVIGRKLLESCITEHLNLYGCLSNIIFRGNILNRVASIMKETCNNLRNNRLMVLFYILMVSSCTFSQNFFVLKKMQSFDEKDCNEQRIQFLNMVSDLEQAKLLNLPSSWRDTYTAQNPVDVKKEITVYYTDSGEYFCAKPIADYAASRGYKIKYTKDVHEKSEIGIYCQHICYPENSKISVIMLHDMAQRHNSWPNIWQVENWHNFTFGVLPGKQWAERWQECAALHYARPKLGAYAFGYPKGDAAFSDEIKSKAAKVRENLKYDFTVLYAPSWENDGKEDDFVRLLHKLPINLIIKQVPVPDDPVFKFVADNIAAMRKKHDGKYDNLTYVEQDENILVALAACDLVVSDESSVMTEATFFGKPSVAVTDWLIPDVKPSRYAIVPVEYVIKIKLAQLHETVRELSTNKEKYEEACQMGRDFFTNRGKASSDIVELIDCIVDNKPLPQNIIDKKLIPDYELVDMWN